MANQIGGGACALTSANRGYATVLLKFFEFY